MTPSKEQQLDTLLQCSLRLHHQVEFVPQPDNGVTQYVVNRGGEQQFFICNEATKVFLQSLDGRDSLANRLQTLPQEQSHDQALALVKQLLQQGYFDGVDKPASASPWWQALKRPVSIKVPLFNPSSLLQRLNGAAAVLFNPIALSMWALLLLLSAMQLAIQWQGLELHWQSRFAEPINLLLFPLAFIVLKACHELGHGLAVKRFGGDVPECGVIFIAFMPLPYVDASASYRMTRRQRVIVGLAGMQVELLLAMLAFWGWCQLSSGLLADLLFNLTFIGSVSTLLFNLNPLMKFDGYYVFSDLLGVINLDSRSRGMLSRRLKRHLLGLESDSTGTELSPWAMLYAIFAIPYRLVISVTIALYLASKFFVFGLILAIWVVLQQMLWPLCKGLWQLYQQAQAQQQQRRYAITVLAGTVFTYLLLFELSLDASDTRYAVVVPAPEQQLRAEADGVVETLLVDNLQRLEQGQAVAQLVNSTLAFDIDSKRMALRALEAEHLGLSQREVHEAQALQEKIAVAKQELTMLKQQASQLTVIAPQSGVAVLARQQDLQGRYVQRGEIIGYLQQPYQLRLVSVLAAEQVEQIGYRLESIEVRFHGLPDKVFAGRIGKAIPEGKSQLPSRFLSRRFGGEIAVDGRDPNGTTTLERVFTAEIDVTGDFNQFAPATAQVRFNYQAETFAEIAKNAFYRGMLKTFNWHFYD